jgi:exo-beta-1,3-glucanase (GH17 family)
MINSHHAYALDFHYMNSAQPHHPWRFNLFCLVLLVLIGAWFWQKNQPVELVDAVLPADGKVQCVSYAPYYGKDQTPFKVGTVISKSQIEVDLKRIAKQSNCVRIYSVGQGLDYVPEAAQKLGMKVLVGAWIGWTAADNDKEINVATALANQYPDTITGLIIGNEVLLRGEQTEDAMLAYIARAKKLTQVPVTYADVWEFWIKHRKLEQSVDFVTIHLLPYWENNPQSVTQSIAHANAVMSKLGATFSKPILIGETGWPSIGRQRGLSTPSQLNQARYIRAFLREANQKQWNYNLIEAFNQPWKRGLEGTVGGFWGIYDTALNPKFALTGQVAERSDHMRPFYFGVGGAILLAGIGFFAGIKHRPSLVSIAILGALTGVMSMLQLEYLTAACGDGAWLSALTCVPSAGRPLAIGIMLLQWCSFGGALISTWLIVLSISLFHQHTLLAIRITQLATLVLLIGAVTIGILLTVDGRYRDFPVMLYTLPVLLVSIGLFLAQSSVRFFQPVYLSLSIAALTAAAIAYLIEPLNSNAVLWFGLTVLLVIPMLLKNKQSQ